MTLKTTEETIAQLNNILPGLTKRPWRYCQIIAGYEARMLVDNDGYQFARVDDLQNGEAIAAAVNALPSLLDDLKELKAENARLRGWEDAVAQFARNADYYRGLLDEIAPLFGHAVYVSDDGSIQDSPLRAKMPELANDMALERELLVQVAEGVGNQEGILTWRAYEAWRAHCEARGK